MIRLATAADIPAVAAIYEAILDQEAESGINYTNWQKGKYPTIDTAKGILEAGTLYVGEDEDGTIWGSMNLNAIQLPEYVKIDWSIPATDDQVAVIHTLTIDPARKGHGLARKMSTFAEDTARAQGKTVMRFDTWEGNKPANHLYPAMDYRYAGSTGFFFMGYTHSTLNLYEKKL